MLKKFLKRVGVDGLLDLIASQSVGGFVVSELDVGVFDDDELSNLDAEFWWKLEEGNGCDMCWCWDLRPWHDGWVVDDGLLLFLIILVLSAVLCFLSLVFGMCCFDIGKVCNQALTQ
jgi:hypothetical protein